MTVSGDDGERRAPAAPEARQTDPQQAVSRVNFRRFAAVSEAHRFYDAGKFSSSRAARDWKIGEQRKDCRKKMSMSQNYEISKPQSAQTFRHFRETQGTRIQ
jgi:hypothetical protein